MKYKSWDIAITEKGKIIEKYIWIRNYGFIKIDLRNQNEIKKM